MAMAHPTDDPLTVKLISPVSTSQPHHHSTPPPPGYNKQTTVSWET